MPRNRSNATVLSAKMVPVVEAYGASRDVSNQCQSHTVLQAQPVAFGRKNSREMTSNISIRAHGSIITGLSREAVLPSSCNHYHRISSRFGNICTPLESI